MPWTLLIVGSVASLVANVAVAEPTMIGRVIAAWPSFALTASYELLTCQVRRTVRDDQYHDKLQKQPGAQLPTAPSDRIRLATARGGELQRQAWEWALARHASDGAMPSGKAIASAYGRHERWGRLVKSAGQAGALGETRAVHRQQLSG